MGDPRDLGWQTPLISEELHLSRRRLTALHWVSQARRRTCNRVNVVSVSAGSVIGVQRSDG